MKVDGMKLPELGHIGVVVDNVSKYAEILSTMLGMKKFEIYYFEPNVAILKGEKIKPFKLKIGISEFNNGIKFEIIQPIIDGGFFRKFLEQEGNGINHLAFYVQNIKEWEKYFSENGFKIFFKAVIEDKNSGKRQIFYTKLKGLNYYYEFAQYY